MAELIFYNAELQTATLKQPTVRRICVFSILAIVNVFIVFSAFFTDVAYYMYFQIQTYNEQINEYMEHTINTQKEHLREMVYRSTVQQEIDRVEATRNNLAGIRDLVRQLQEALADYLL